MGLAFIENVLGRIDKKLNEKYYVEILINDDSSSDRTLEITKSFCKGNVVSILEGGYDLVALQESTGKHVDALIEFNW